jgi:hypothetical protein
LRKASSLPQTALVSTPSSTACQHFSLSASFSGRDAHPRR